MSTLARQVLGASRKRRERESLDGDGGFRAPPPTKPRIDTVKPGSKPSSLCQLEPPPVLLAKNRLLAGYLAHEFLNKGTLLGQPFNPARAETTAEPDELTEKAYAELAYLLKFDGTHIPGVVNPTQLGCWIQKGKM